MVRAIIAVYVLPGGLEPFAELVESGARPLSAPLMLGGEPLLALGEQAAHLAQQDGCRSLGAAELVDPFEASQNAPGLFHQARLERSYAFVCAELSRGRRQSRQ
jgi:hypothetical protein